MLNRLLTKLFTPSRAARQAIARFTDVINIQSEVVNAHEKAIQKLADSFEELRSAHYKLRGRFYAARGAGGDDEIPPSGQRLTPEQKAKLLRMHSPIARAIVAPDSSQE